MTAKDNLEDIQAVSANLFQKKLASKPQDVKQEISKLAAEKSDVSAAFPQSL